MNERSPGGGPAPWPLAAGDPPVAPGRRPQPSELAPPDGIDAAGAGGAIGSGSADLVFFGAAGLAPARLEIAAADALVTPRRPSDGSRAVGLIQARDALAAALVLLDQHSRSPAAANVDLAIHYINSELGR